MKIPSQKLLVVPALAGLVLILQSTVASGAPIAFGEIAAGDASTFTPPASLIQGITASSTNGTPVAVGTFADWPQLNDGLVGTANGSNSQALLLDNVVNPYAIWTLDTSVNTLGYDITSFQSFAGFDSNRGWQAIEIRYALVGETIVPNMDLAHTLSGGPFTYQPTNPGGSGYYSSKMSIEDSVFGANLLSGVSAIQVLYPNNGFGPNQTSYREFSVVGSATAIPEPSTVLLLVSASFGFILFLRRRTLRQ